MLAMRKKLWTLRHVNPDKVWVGNFNDQPKIRAVLLKFLLLTFPIFLTSYLPYKVKYTASQILKAQKTSKCKKESIFSK